MGLFDFFESAIEAINDTARDIADYRKSPDPGCKVRPRSFPFEWENDEDDED